MGAETPRPRLDGIDLVRGLVIVLMALDHTKDFFQYKSDIGRATDIGHTTLPLFFTRWVTHYCAPTFVFLAGTGAYFGLKRGWRSLSLFLLTRGLWLAVLEITLVHYLWFFDLSYRELPLQVIWAIGVSMMLLAAFVWMPPWVVGVIGVAIIFDHNMLDPIKVADVTEWTGSHNLGRLWAIMHSFEPIRFSRLPATTIYPAYAVLPWFGVMAAGYGVGSLFALPPERRRPILFALGTLVSLEFVVVRGLNVYGDPKPWESWSPRIYTLLSILNCHKYPPSLDYCLMTLGPALIALAVFDHPAGRAGKVLVTFGRVPLFFYLLHLPAIQLLATIVAFVGVNAEQYSSLSAARDMGLGFRLPTVYLAWLLVVFALYWPCRWYAGVKSASRSAWLSYL